MGMILQIIFRPVKKKKLVLFIPNFNAGESCCKDALMQVSDAVKMH